MDREEFRRAFEAILTEPQHGETLTIKGPSGIGKSRLLLQLHKDACNFKVPATIIDFASGEAMDGLRLIQHAARELGPQHFRALDNTLKEALQYVLEIKSGPAATRIVVKKGAKVGDIAGGNIFKDNTFVFSGDARPNAIWMERINEAFLDDLAGLAATKGAVLLLDSLERVAESGRSWIIETLRPRVERGLLPGLHVVMAGETLDVAVGWPGPLIEKQLAELPAVEVRRYLLEKREMVVSDEFISMVLDVTKGRADLVALVADVGKECALSADIDAPELRRILVGELLHHAQPPIPDTLRRAAVPEWFDAALLADLLDESDERARSVEAGLRLADLQSYSFVQTNDRGRVTFTKDVRPILLASWDQAPDGAAQLQQLNARAAQHFDRRAKQTADPLYHNEYERQAIGHLLAVPASELAACNRLCKRCEEYAVQGDMADIDALLQRADAVVGLTDLTQAWLHYQHGFVALARHELRAAATAFQETLKRGGRDSDLCARVASCQGELAAESSAWEDAVARHEEARRYYHAVGDWTREARETLFLGDVHVRQARALGGAIEPVLAGGSPRIGVEAVPAALVSLPFAIYARAIRRWRLPPLHQSMDYRNWTVARLLLTATNWYREVAGSTGKGADEVQQYEACRQLAEVYYLLGWWHDAEEMYKKVREHRPVAGNPYRQALVGKALAEVKLASGQPDLALGELQASAQTFRDYKDEQTLAEIQRLKGQAQAQLGVFDGEEGALACFERARTRFLATEDWVRAGALNSALRSTIQACKRNPKQVAELEALAAGIPHKIYYPRLQDRAAAVMELALGTGLAVVLIAALCAGAWFVMSRSSMQQVWQTLRSPATWLALAGAALLIVWGCVLITGVVGLLLIRRQARRKLEPENLCQITIHEKGISRHDYGKSPVSIAWGDVRAVVWQDRILWRTTMPLLSSFCLHGSGKPFCVPATMLWYDALKREVQDHLTSQNPRPVEHCLDLHIFRSRLGACALMSPLLLTVGFVVAYEVPAPRPWLDAIAIAASILVFLAVLAMMAGPYWWLAIYPFRARYQTAPRSRAPGVAAAVGLAGVAFALYMRFYQPYYPIRHWMDVTFHPAAFVLVIIALLWVWRGRDWLQPGLQRGEPLYPAAIRRCAAAALVPVLVASTLFLFQAGAYFATFPLVSFLQAGEYQATIDLGSRLARLDDGLADAYAFPARAYMEASLEDPDDRDALENDLSLCDRMISDADLDQAVLRGIQAERSAQSLTHLIDAPGQKLTSYWWLRSCATRAAYLAQLRTGTRPAIFLETACGDLKAIVSEPRWQADACQSWQQWTCGTGTETIERYCASPGGGEHVALAVH